MLEQSADQDLRGEGKNVQVLLSTYIGQSLRRYMTDQDRESFALIYLIGFMARLGVVAASDVRLAGPQGGLPIRQCGLRRLGAPSFLA